MPRTQALSFAIRQRASPLSRLRSYPTYTHLTFFQPHDLFNANNSSNSTTRHFTHRPSLYILARPSLSRPQLPFLHHSSGSRLHPSATHRTFLARYITTERKRRWRQTLRWQLRFHAYLWPSLFLVGIMLSGIHQVKIEGEYPTPREWGFWTRWYLRTAKFTEFDAGGRIDRVLVDWAKAARFYKGVVDACEDETKEGKNVRKGEEVLVDIDGGGVGLGWDVGAKTEEWRTGYHEALMGCARCAENLDGMARRKGDEYGNLIPWESVIGPRNARPKPLPWDKKGEYKQPPREDEVEDAFPKPETFYMRILTTEGFTTRQRLDAAIGYADWCDFKGLGETAGSMYDWALDIAAGALPMGADGVVDIMTGVINQGKDDFVSENLLRASSAMGVHHARRGDVKMALPIFLSVLRARRTLPAPTAEVEKQLKRSKAAKAAKKEEGLIMAYLSALKDFVVEKPYPVSASSGNDRPYHSLNEACEEVGLMTYIGEILFATGDQEREKGLSWTRDSVGAAEAVLWVMDEMEEGDGPGRERCRECLETGIDNWKQMTQQMAKLAKIKLVEAEGSSGWLGLGIGKDSTVRQAKQELSKWEEEESQVELRKLKTASLVHPLRPLQSKSAVYTS